MRHSTLTPLNSITAGLRGDDLAYATLDYIREHPDEWDQRQYTCGTTACFAGRAILIALGLKDEQELVAWCRANTVPDSSSVIASRLLDWDPAMEHTVYGNITRDFSELEMAVKDMISNHRASHGSSRT